MAVWRILKLALINHFLKHNHCLIVYLEWSQCWAVVEVLCMHSLVLLVPYNNWKDVTFVQTVYLTALQEYNKVYLGSELATLINLYKIAKQ